MVEAQQQQQSFRPKLGVLAVTFTLVILSFMTFFSVELTSLRLTGIKPSDDELKPLIQPLRQIFLNDEEDYPDNYTDDINATTIEHEASSHETTMTDNHTALLQLQISQGKILNAFNISQIHDAIYFRSRQYRYAKDTNTLPSSPACYPHFNHYPPTNNNEQLFSPYNNTTKFKRILFYHARKAGGSSMNKYLVKVAQRYGLHIEWIEWKAMEEPGVHFDKEDTFYVTHVREPIERSISHFKYNGRWPCRTLVTGDFEPTLENAMQLETWNETQGHEPKKQCHINRVPGETEFSLGDCAVNCYTQWFGGLNCPSWSVPMDLQYDMAMSKLLKYNLIVVIDKLKDANYVEAIENFFGVEGLLERGTPFCERKSHKANAEHPLVVRNETRAKLVELNEFDLKLYHEITDCLENGNYGGIPKWDGGRFMIDSYNWTEAELEKQRAKAAKALQNSGR